MSRTVYDLIGLAAGIAFILALKGLSHPKTARRGNLIGAFGAGLATLVVFFYSNEGSSLPLNNLGWILGAIAVGLIIGVPAARKVQMTQMPQLVALFNGVGGGAAALVAIVEYLNLGDKATTAVVVFTVFTVIVGCVSFSGSIITFMKLQELMTTRPVIFPAGRFIIAATLVSVIGVGGWVVNSLGTTPLLILAGAFIALWYFVCASSWWRRCTDRYLIAQRIHWPNSGGKWLCSRFNLVDHSWNPCWCFRNHLDSFDGRGDGPFTIWNFVWCIYCKATRCCSGWRGTSSAFRFT
jgi:NAD/NADP transhydrogenase beta subunit